MPKEKNLEFTVGLFVLLALIGLTAFIFSISDSFVFQQGKTIKALFEFANGLKKNAPIRIAGVDEGIVKDIKLYYDTNAKKTKIEVLLWFRKETQIPADSAIKINQLGLLGEKYIEITPGIDTENFFKEGDIVMGIDPISQDAISAKVMDVATRLEKSVAAVNAILLDDKNVSALSSTFDNINRLTGNLNDIAINVKEGKGTIGHLFYDEGLYDNIEAMTADLKENPWKLLYRPRNK